MNCYKMKETENDSSILTSKHINCIFIWNQYGKKIGQLKNIESQTKLILRKVSRISFLQIHRFSLKDLGRRSELQSH
jgi:hypothetical protein